MEVWYWCCKWNRRLKFGKFHFNLWTGFQPGEPVFNRLNRFTNWSGIFQSSIPFAASVSSFHYCVKISRRYLSILLSTIFLEGRTTLHLCSPLNIGTYTTHYLHFCCNFDAYFQIFVEQKINHDGTTNIKTDLKLTKLKSVPTWGQKKVYE